MVSATALRKVKLDECRLQQDLDALSAIGATQDGGVSRPAYSSADLAARSWVEDQMREAGMAVRRDGIGNSIGSYPGQEDGLPPIALGSHTDTVPEGGRFDGALGVLAGIACVRTLSRREFSLRHPVEVINFAAEEATLGGTLGSRAMAGKVDSDFLEGNAWDGRSISDHLARAGLDPRGLERAARKKGSLCAYLELHVEQGPVLAGSEARFGVIEGIVGIRRYTITFRGDAGHAGTTPMADRNDALVSAGPFIADVRDMALTVGVVATVGAMTVMPGTPSVIPGRVDLSVDARHLSELNLDEFERVLLQRVEASGGTAGIASQKPPVVSSERIVQLLCDVGDELDIPYLRMTSGAGHDAGPMGTLTDQAMIFVASRNGASHCPAEYTDPDSCALGALLLFEGLLKADARFN